MNYLAEISQRHAIDPESIVHYINPVNGNEIDVYALSGDRDFNSTACPGGKLYADLPAIRRDAKAAWGTG